MKMLVVYLICPALFLGLITFGCKKDTQKPSEINLPIVSELPLLYQGINLKSGNCVLIESQIELDTIFSKNLVDQLAIGHLDFTKYNVLLGANVFTHGIFKMEHYLIKTDNLTYTYRVKVFYDLTHIAGTFFYGIIIDKVPEGILVQCDLIKINE